MKELFEYGIVDPRRLTLADIALLLGGATSLEVVTPSFMFKWSMTRSNDRVSILSTTKALTCLGSTVA